jgi:hypothetical protein
MDPKAKQSIFGRYQALAGAKVNKVEDTMKLYDHREGLIRDEIAKGMTEADRKALLSGLKLAAKRKDPKETSLSAADIAAAKAAEAKLAAAARKRMPSAAFAEALAKDKKYRTLVRNAVEHMKPKEPTKPGADATAEQRAEYAKKKSEYEALKKKHDEAVKSYDDRLAFLGERGMLPGPDDIALADARESLTILDAVRKDAKRGAMQNVAILPLIMAACYLGLIIYFSAKGGYKVVDLAADGHVAGEHPVSTDEAVADAEATPSE